MMDDELAIETSGLVKSYGKARVLAGLFSLFLVLNGTHLLYSALK